MKFNLSNINSVRPIVRQALRYKKSGSALDLGCGAGRHALFLAKKGFRVTAVDKSSENIAALKELARLQKLPITTLKADVTEFNSGKKFDLIVSTMVLHFLPDRAQKQVIRITQNHTNGTGINVVSSYTDKNKKEVRPHLVNANKLQKQYVKAGWRILHFQERLSEPMTTSSGTGKLVRYWVVELIAQKVK